jgi:uncharacterized membrane-anchored protein YjiN (DUF445 family)
MVAVKIKTSNHLHAKHHLKGEGIKDILNSVKSFANNVRQKLKPSTTRKEGAKSLKEIAQKLKDDENKAYAKKMFSDPAISRKNFLTAIRDEKEKNKIRKMNASYKDFKSPLEKLIEKQKIENLKEKDKPKTINKLNIDPSMKNILQENLGFKNAIQKDNAYIVGKSQTPGFYNREEKHKKNMLNKLL